MIIGIDAGNYNVKSVTEANVDRFRSNIIPYFERTLENKHGDDDMVVEYEGKKFYAGSVAKYEDKYQSEPLSGETKNHEEAKLRILIAVHRQTDDGEKVFVVVGQPISNHTENEKNGIVERLKGTHRLIINGVEKTFEIVDARVAPEGGAAFFCSPKQGKIHILDVGSGTVNYAQLLDGKYISAKSNTLPFGLSEEDTDFDYLANAINSKLSKLWGKRAEIWVCGGGASQLVGPLQEYFPNAKEMKPIFKIGEGFKQFSPQYANAIGFYNMAKKVFSK